MDKKKLAEEIKAATEMEELELLCEENDIHWEVYPSSAYHEIIVNGSWFGRSEESQFDALRKGMLLAIGMER